MKPHKQCLPRDTAKFVPDVVDSGIIVEAREKEIPVVIVMAVLTMADGSKRIAFPNCEYGDGDAEDRMLDFVEEVREGGILLPGESIDFMRAELPVSTVLFAAGASNPLE